MSARLDELEQRKNLLVARLQLQRLELTLHAGELRDSLRPKRLIGGSIAQPAALIALLETLGPLFGLRRLARWARVAGVAFVAFRIVRNWRGSASSPPEPPIEAPSP